MNNNTTAPTYTLRGLQLIGWRDMQHALDYLFADGQLKQGTLVAINAEKMLTIEDNAEVRELINAAEFKYADGISVVRSVRKKYPQAQVSRVAGADLWEELMARAGKEGTPVFLVGGKPEVLAQTEAKLRNQWNVNFVGAPGAGDLHARLPSGASRCAVYGRWRDLRCFHRSRKTRTENLANAGAGVALPPAFAAEPH